MVGAMNYRNQIVKEVIFRTHHMASKIVLRRPKKIVALKKPPEVQTGFRNRTNPHSRLMTSSSSTVRSKQEQLVLLKPFDQFEAPSFRLG